MSGYCPIGFGDCPDCNHYREFECQYGEEVLGDYRCDGYDRKKDGEE